jgi:hypothetical protein
VISKVYAVTEAGNTILVTGADIERARVFAQFNVELEKTLIVLDSLEWGAEVILTNNNKQFVWTKIR